MLDSSIEGGSGLSGSSSKGGLGVSSVLGSSSKDGLGVSSVLGSSSKDGLGATDSSIEGGTDSFSTGVLVSSTRELFSKLLFSFFGKEFLLLFNEDSSLLIILPDVSLSINSIFSSNFSICS